MGSDLQRRQLDRRFDSSRDVLNAMSSHGNWVRSVRQALCMTQTQLARRMGLTQPTLARIEKDEGEGRLTLHILTRVAEALECRLIYALVPVDDDLEGIVRRRAGDKARRLVSGVDQTMVLEGQGVSGEEREALIEETARDILAHRPASIWDDDD